MADARSRDLGPSSFASQCSRASASSPSPSTWIAVLAAVACVGSDCSPRSPSSPRCMLPADVAPGRAPRRVCTVVLHQRLDLSSSSSQASSSATGGPIRPRLQLHRASNVSTASTGASPLTSYDRQVALTPLRVLPRRCAARGSDGRRAALAAGVTFAILVALTTLASTRRAALRLPWPVTEHASLSVSYLLANPLVVRAAWFGKADALTLLLVVLAFGLAARKRPGWSGATLGAAILTKQFALVAVPFLAATLLVQSRDVLRRAAFVTGRVVPPASSVPHRRPRGRLARHRHLRSGHLPHRRLRPLVTASQSRHHRRPQRRLPLLRARRPRLATGDGDPRASTAARKGAMAWRSGLHRLVLPDSCSSAVLFHISYLVYPLTGILLAALLAFADGCARRATADGDIERVRARLVGRAEHEHLARPIPRRPAKSHLYESASVRTRTENRFPATTSIRSRESSTKRTRTGTARVRTERFPARSTARSRISYIPGGTTRPLMRPNQTSLPSSARNLLCTRCRPSTSMTARARSSMRYVAVTRSRLPSESGENTAGGRGRG